MKNRTRLLRIAAVGSSLLLVAIYVSCQANQHDPDPAPPEDQPQPGPATHLPGSKSAEIFPPPPTPQTMGGSKSRAVLTPDDLVTPGAPQAQPAQTNSPRP